MRVLMNTGPWLAVPGSTGGVEALVAALVPPLRRAGVEVVLASVGCSTLEVEELAWAYQEPQHEWMGRPYSAGVSIAAAHLEVVRQRVTRGDIDLVHDHSQVIGPVMYAAMGAACPPVVWTIHAQTVRPVDEQIYARFDSTQIRVVPRSAEQADALPPNLRRLVAGVVPNAVRVPDLAADPSRDGPALMLAEMFPRKRQDFLVAAFAALRLPLLLAGSLAGVTDPAEAWRRIEHDPVYAALPAVAYYSHQVRPHETCEVRWVGALAGSAKWRALTHARALVSWAGRGQAVLEALALGVPVVCPRPAVGDQCLIVDGHNGAWFDPDERASLRASLDRAAAIDSAACRSSVGHLTPEAMAAGYLDIYQRILG